MCLRAQLNAVQHAHDLYGILAEGCKSPHKPTAELARKVLDKVRDLDEVQHHTISELQRQLERLTGECSIDLMSINRH